MKRLILFVLFALLSGNAHAQAAPVVKNMGSDPYPAGPQPTSCKLYLAGVLVVTTPSVTSGTTKACFFPNITLQPGQSYTATGVDATGFESAQSVPFVLPVAPTAPTGLRVVP